VWEKFASYDEAGDFGAWARRIAHFEVLTHRGKVRRERVRLSQEALDLVAETAATASVEAESRFRALADCLNKLSDAGRELLWRCYSGSAAVKDVAVSLGRSVRGTQRAVAKLRFTVQQCVERNIERENRP
jgi:RNA polymerase sigma-70 factor (ECF subfamily)